MEPIKNWDKVQEAGSEIQNLPAGGYICEIKQCKEKLNRKGGYYLEVMFDICEVTPEQDKEYIGWFEKDYRSQNREDKYWHGIFYQNKPDEKSDKFESQCSFLKKFTNAVEQSNEGYHWDWQEELLKGKRIGIIFGEVEKQSKAGKYYMTTKPDSVASVAKIRSGNYSIPEPQLINKNASSNSKSSEMEDADGALPF